jgi:hypothetical protein
MRPTRQVQQLARHSDGKAGKALAEWLNRAISRKKIIKLVMSPDPNPLDGIARAHADGAILL